MQSPKATNSMSASSVADLSSSFDHAPWAVIASSGEAHIVRYANPAFCRLINKAHAEVVGRPLDGMAPQTDEFLARLDYVFRTGETASYISEEQASPLLLSLLTRSGRSWLTVARRA